MESEKRDKQVHGSEKGVTEEQTERDNDTGFEDEERPWQGMGEPIELGKDKEMDSSLEPPERYTTLPASLFQQSWTHAVFLIFRTARFCICVVLRH